MQTLPTLLSFVVPFVPSEFLNAHQQFFEAIAFGVKSIVFVTKLLFLSQPSTFYESIPIFWTVFIFTVVQPIFSFVLIEFSYTLLFIFDFFHEPIDQHATELIFTILSSLLSIMLFFLIIQLFIVFISLIFNFFLSTFSVIPPSSINILAVFFFARRFIALYVAILAFIRPLWPTSIFSVVRAPFSILALWASFAAQVSAFNFI